MDRRSPLRRDPATTRGEHAIPKLVLGLVRVDLHLSINIHDFVKRMRRRRILSLNSPSSQHDREIAPNPLLHQSPLLRTLKCQASKMIHPSRQAYVEEDAPEVSPPLFLIFPPTSCRVLCSYAISASDVFLYKTKDMTRPSSLSKEDLLMAGRTRTRKWVSTWRISVSFALWYGIETAAAESVYSYG
jgi:hypothetical protein